MNLILLDLVIIVESLQIYLVTFGIYPLIFMSLLSLPLQYQIKAINHSLPSVSIEELLFKSYIVRRFLFLFNFMTIHNIASVGMCNKALMAFIFVEIKWVWLMEFKLLDLYLLLGPVWKILGTGSLVSLNNTNSNSLANIAASLDGRLWLQGQPNVYAASAVGGSYAAYSYILPVVINFKSPGAPDQNYAGSWSCGISNSIAGQYDADSGVISEPYAGYFICPQSIIYDDSRQALYAIYAAQSPNNSQNMRIYFIISRDNGQTWSSPIDIATSDKGNRGFPSMALNQTIDPVSGKLVSGSLVFGWYDGRNDPTFQSVEYYAAIIPAKKLDKLVNAIPLSHPIYTVCPACPCPQPPCTFQQPPCPVPPCPTGATAVKAPMDTAKDRVKHNRMARKLKRDLKEEGHQINN